MDSEDYKQNNYKPDKKLHPDKSKVVTIKKDFDCGVFVFRFPFSSVYDYKKPVYVMIGRMHLEVGENSIISYSVEPEDILEIKIKIDCDSKEAECKRIQEILHHWHDSDFSQSFLFSPVNIDLVLSSSFWPAYSCTGEDEEIITEVKSGAVSTYCVHEFKWKYYFR